MYDAQIGRWNHIDAKSELYFNWSPYSYALNTPVNAIDPDGKLVIFINGFANSEQQGNSSYWRQTLTTQVGEYRSVPSQEGTRQEWYYRTVTTQNNFDEQVKSHFNDKKSLYLDGSVGGTDNWMSEPDLISTGTPPNLNAAFRYNVGYTDGEGRVATIIQSLVKSGGVISESIKVVAHSMGGAYGKGFIQAIVDYAKKHPDQCRGLSITEFDFASFQQNQQKGVKGTILKQYDNKGDKVVGEGLYGSQFATEEGAESRTMDNTPGKGHSIFDFMGQINNLTEGTYIFKDGQFIKVN